MKKTIKTKEKMNSQIVLLGNVYRAQFGTGYAGNVWDKKLFLPPPFGQCRGWKSSYEWSYSK